VVTSMLQSPSVKPALVLYIVEDGVKFYYSRINDLKGLLNGHLDSPQSKFQISNYHLPCRKLGFFSINTFMCALNQGAHFPRFIRVESASS
jgi:hypothetical protein